MAATLDDLKSRLHNAQESLDTELKSWVDPATDAGKKVIAGACMALRNNNGGFLIIGIRDDGKPDDRSLFPDLRKAFHSDIVQDIVSKYSSERFQVTVHFVERDGLDRVMIEVPTGIRIPVICRNDLPRKGNDKNVSPGTMLAENTVYVRTLESNGRPSTAPAKITDWPRLMEHCFENREADIGAFIRRQLSGINVNATSSALLEFLQAAKAPTPTEIAMEYLDWCFVRFTEKKMLHRPLPPTCGTRDAAAVITGDFKHPELTLQFINRLSSQQHRYSGWAPWVGLSNIATDRSGAMFVKNGWESLVYETSPFDIFDFSRIDESGKFYYLEGFRDDMTHRVPKGKYLEFVLETRRVAEILAATLTYSRAFCEPNRNNNLVVAMRWKGLLGRHLASWANPNRNFMSANVAQDDEKITQITMPIATATSAIGLHVESLVKPVFRLFGGLEFESSVIQQIVDSTLRDQN